MHDEDQQESETEILNRLFELIREDRRYEVNKWFKVNKISDFIFSNWSPTHEAAEHGQTEILWDLLHRYNFNPDRDYELEPYYEEVYGTGREYKNKYTLCNGSILTLALANGHLAAAELLIRKGANVNATFYSSGGSKYNEMAGFFGQDLSVDNGNCLLLALAQDADSIVDLMQAHGLVVDGSWDRNGQNVFSTYLYKGDAKGVAKLLSMGADPDQSVIDNDDVEWNALYFAVDNYLGSTEVKRKNWLAIIDLLLKHGARLDYRESGGEDDTVLEKVMESGDEVLAARFGLDQVIATHQEARTLLENHRSLSDLEYFHPYAMPPSIRETLSFKQVQALVLVEESIHSDKRLICLPPRTCKAFKDQAKLILLIVCQLKQFRNILLITDRFDDHPQWERAFNQYRERHGEQILLQSNMDQLSLDISMINNMATHVTLDCLHNIESMLHDQITLTHNYDLVIFDEQHQSAFSYQMAIISKLDARLTIML